MFFYKCFSNVFPDHGVTLSTMTSSRPSPPIMIDDIDTAGDSVSETSSIFSSVGSIYDSVFGSDAPSSDDSESESTTNFYTEEVCGQHYIPVLNQFERQDVELISQFLEVDYPTSLNAYLTNGRSVENTISSIIDDLTGSSELIPN